METSPSPAMPRSLFVFSLFYGGMVCISGVLGVKQVALGPLAVEAGIFGFLLLVVMGSAIAELHGRKTADALVRWGFLPLIVSALLIQLVLALPHDPGMYPPAIDAFPIVVGQSARMMIAGLISYGSSQTLNILIFSKLKGQEGAGRLVCHHALERKLPMNLWVTCLSLRQVALPPNEAVGPSFLLSFLETIRTHGPTSSFYWIFTPRAGHSTVWKPRC